MSFVVLGGEGPSRSLPPANEGLLSRQQTSAPAGRGKRLLIRDARLVSELVASGARLIAAYESFSIVEVDGKTAAAAGRNASVVDVDHHRRILLNAGTIDTGSEPRGIAQQATGNDKSMHLVHFAAPPLPEWYRALEANGAMVVTYVPHNTYLVYGEASAIARVRAFARNHPAIDWDGPYGASHRIHRRITTKPGKDGATPQEYSIQLVDDAAVNAATLAIIDARREGSLRRESTSLHYRNVIATLPYNALQQIAARPDVVSIQPYAVPKKHDERQNQIIAGNLTGTAPTAPGYLAWVEALGFTQAQFDASGFVVDLTDSGVDNGTTNPNHFALFKNGTFGAGNSRVAYNRLVGTPNSGSTIAGCDGHGTINAHIIGGFVDSSDAPHADTAGFRYGLGVAPWVRVGSTVIFDPANYTYPDLDAIQSAAYNDGARISSNSWGAPAGGAYNVDAQAYDALVRDAQPSGSAFPAVGNQEMVILFSAGNSGSSSNTTGSPGTGKNVFTIGASENVHPFGGADGCGFVDGLADSAEDVAFFSSRGPTDDGRIKPDVVAPGTHITGGVAQAAQIASGNGAALACFDAEGICGGVGQDFFPAGQSFYSSSSGTSHSAPAVAGAAALLRQKFINDGRTPPSPALTKALFMNSARYLNGMHSGGTLPSNSQGMGAIDLGGLFDDAGRFVREQNPADTFTATGQTRTFTGSISDATRPVRVTLAWTDAPGSTTGNSFNNDLDLTVTIGGVTYRGNVFSGQFSTTSGTADVRNNVESVFLPAGTVGSYAVTVSASSINSDGVPGNDEPLDQDFALVVSNFSTTGVPAMAKAGATLAGESCLPANGVVDSGEAVTFSFALQNFGTLDTTDLVATLQEGNGVLAPGASQSYGVVVAGGASVARPFSFVVDAACGDGIVATLVLSDAGQPMGTVSFNLSTGTMVVGGTTTVSNGDGVTIRDQNSALPYPSVINVSGLSGVVHEVTVTLSGLSHDWGGDIDAFLVAPDNSAVLLMSDTIEAVTSGSSIVVTFDDDAPTSMTSWSSGTYLPTDNEGGVPDYNPFPYGVALADLEGGSPNGSWRLFIRDDGFADTGSLLSWSLDITTSAPVCCTSSTTFFSFDSAASNVAEGDGVATTTIVRGGNLAAGAIRVTSLAGTADSGDFEALDRIVSFAVGERSKNVDVVLRDDGDDEAAEAFSLVLSAPSANGELGPNPTTGITIQDDDDPAFTITSISPDNGSHTGGTTIEVTGTGFDDSSTWTVGGVAATAATFSSATSVTLVVPALPAGALYDVAAKNASLNVAKLRNGWLADFADVAQTHGFHDFVESIVRYGVTAGCGGGNYCPSNPVTRAQMAVFLLRSKHGSSYLPPAPALPGFSDVPAGSPFKAWIEALAAAGVTAGCGGGNYCPDNPATREQMAVFLLLMKEGSSYTPIDATGIFGDVPPSSPFARWIEELSRRGITAGCGNGNYCPGNENSRAEMAVFLKTTFGLP